MRVLQAEREPRTHPQLECRAQGQGTRQWLALIDLLQTDTTRKVIAHRSPELFLQPRGQQLTLMAGSEESHGVNVVAEAVKAEGQSPVSHQALNRLRRSLHKGPFVQPLRGGTDVPKAIRQT
jgi:hypothetical protein